MLTSRSILSVALVAAATACSSTDVTRPGLDAATLTSVANTVPPSAASRITIAPATATVAVGATLTLTGSITSATGVDLTARLASQTTLTSSDTTIATIAPTTGIVTGVRAGVAKITATLGTLSSSSTITVTGGASTSPSRITLTPASATIAVGSSIALSGSITSATGVNLTATFAAQATVTSSDTTIAAISRTTGVVMGLRNGVALITVKLGPLSSSSTITVGTGVATTTPAPTPTPPTQSGASPVSALAMISDNYTHYSSTQALLANISSNIGGTGSPGTALYNDGANAQLLTLDNTVTYNGHATVKYNQPGGVATTPQLWVTFPGGKTLTNMWVRTKVRYSPGYTTYGVTPNCANAYKLLGWGWYGSDGRASLEFTNTNQYVFVWYVTNSAATMSGESEFDGPHTTTEWTDGRWYDYIVHYAQTSSTAITMSWWLAPDGQPPVLQQTITGTMTVGQAPPVNRVLLGLNFNSQRPATETQALWYGQWEVIDGAQHQDPYSLGVQ